MLQFPIYLLSDVRDYGENRYGRLVADLEVDGDNVGRAGVKAGHLRDWMHIKGMAQYAKPVWCARAAN